MNVRFVKMRASRVKHVVKKSIVVGISGVGGGLGRKNAIPSVRRTGRLKAEGWSHERAGQRGGGIAMRGMWHLAQDFL